MQTRNFMHQDQRTHTKKNLSTEWIPEWGQERMKTHGRPLYIRMKEMPELTIESTSEGCNTGIERSVVPGKKERALPETV